MQVKNKYEKYNNWKTVDNWKKEHKTVIDETQILEMWSNQYCRYKCLYAAPENVREMTPGELEKYQERQRELNRLGREYYKRKREEERRIEIMIWKRRLEWNTPFQWLDKGRMVNDNAVGEMGRDLNYGRDSSSPFGNDYLYFNFKDTRPFKNDQEKEDELKRLLAAIGRTIDD